MIEQTETAAQADAAPEIEYAIVEVFGHRRHVGRIEEVDRFGAKLLRIDVPKEGDFEKGYVTHFYGGGSIFSLTPTDADTVKRFNASYRPYGAAALPAPDYASEAAQYKSSAEPDDEGLGEEGEEG